ncbi:hypothetical protein BJX68DRAFT_226399 [Aspergillus pseudodeflectus]|uniref:Uncharacterized protein n=1 Tax=Aspergillus pseudodeflectus TaxID=176178 RepID=A0ABR4L7U7_9EURO
MALTMRSSILAISLALLANAQTEQDFEACDPLDLFDPCIDPMTLGTVTLNFEPLFPEPVDFTWGFALQNNYEYYPGAPDTKVAYWLEYNSTQPPAAEPHDTYMVMVLGGAGGITSGGHNGCDGPLGEECAENFAGFIKEHIAGQANRTDEMLDEALYAFRDEGVPQSIGCAENYFRSFYAVTHYELLDGILAREDGKSLDIIQSGNESFPFNTYVHQRTPYGYLINKVAVPVIVRLPSEGDSWRDVENIQVEFGCARSAPVNQPDYLDEESDEVDEEEDTESTDDTDSTEDTGDSDDSQAPGDQSETEPNSDESTTDEPAAGESSSGELTEEEAGSLSTEYGGNGATGMMWSATLASIAGAIAIARIMS